MKLSICNTGGEKIEMFENGVLWKIFGPKCDTATGYCKIRTCRIGAVHHTLSGCKITGSNSGTA
jgi:hypothetical protein